MRRVTLAVCALTVVLAFAGCSGTGPAGSPTDTSSPTATATPDTPTPPQTGSYDVIVLDSGPAAYPVIEGGLVPNITSPPTERHYGTLLSDSSAVNRFNHSVLPDDATTFVEETDFETASLLVVQAYPKSSVPDYRVESVTRDGDRLHVRLNDSSHIGTDDITLETVIVRVVHDGDAPQSATIETQDGATLDIDDGADTVARASSTATR